MKNLLPMLFALNFSIFLLHEMDAVRAKEWKMFVFFKDMKEQTGYIIFALVHLPVYYWVIYTISQAWYGAYVLVYMITDIFLILHAAVHWCFRKHAANGFSSKYSMILIYSMGAIALIRLLILYLV